MHLTNYVAQVWQAVSSMPTPGQVQQQLLREAQLDYLKARSAAEDHSVHMEAYQHQANMLAARIERLERLIGGAA